jgi:hypothetical protein
MSLLLAAAAAAVVPSPRALAWEGTAEVYPPGHVVEIVVHTRIDRDGSVVSESWPAALGRDKGLHRMTLDASGGTLERGTTREPMPRAQWDEEHAQFGFYRQLQIAAARAPRSVKHGVYSTSVPGAVTTRFRLAHDGTIRSAANRLPSPDKPGGVHQEFHFHGWWRSNGAIFPKTMRMLRDGKPHFTLHVTRFDAR